MAIETLQCKDFRIMKDGTVDIGVPEDILDKINNWISDNSVRVVSIESIIDTGSGNSITHEFNGARVWFMAAGVVE